MKKILFSLILLSTLWGLNANASTAIDRAIYIECDSCSSTTDFKSFGIAHFNENYAQNLNQMYSYTIVNQSTQLAVFLDIQHRYMPDPESGYPLDVIIPTLLTSETEMTRDYTLSKYVVRHEVPLEGSSSYSQVFGSFNIMQNSQPGNEYEVVEVSIDGSTLSYVSLVGMGVIRSEISSKLESHLGGQDWVKLKGRTIIIVKFNDGKLAAFFNDLSTAFYVYMEDTGVDNNGNPVNVTGPRAEKTGGSGGGNGITSHGSGSWSILRGGQSVCTSVEGLQPVCYWIPF